MDATMVPKIAHGHSQSVFVLSADGSQLYLLDPTRPQTGEHPPPYAPPERERRLRTRASTVSSAVPRSPTRPLRPLLPLRGLSDAALGQSTVVDERTPLLPRDPPSRPRWRSIFRNNSEISQTRRRSGIAKYFATLGSAKHWGAAFHLLILNFPFALLIWSILVAGTLVGTALLITLPIGAAVWFLLLLLTRTAARIEMAMQRYYHAPDTYRATRPIFKRLKEPASPRSSRSTSASALAGATNEPEWETSIGKNAVAMFSDHYSYKALSYLLLTKAVVTLLSTIIVWPLFIVCAVLVLPLPAFLGFVRRFGKWQAGIAGEALA